ncbi:PTS sugar transporter subunit IIA [Lactiplantibacillus mudanjiangensis]|uniref:Galactitol PTS, EIIA [Lactobacillus plantarum JDM1] n=1 Tax=Lactiplantibacillus mudanjiangensis TaxID=1296538 RepID=A0A660DY58_9LACO|nr:PTS sugar transporter subunit IIA [Lactiplantibacillus mudanjiangensis]VDG22607.1 galactitol PTS, EIIA [Lactobacillus plantarum JDM1] [Lactiplantibacillus mudanjiangensis]VDG26853.1 galactitol PTS, EIIA [Lactobacillus plantarum JDM1] [Lactiplantibacillus mudanjiangensis]
MLAANSTVEVSDYLRDQLIFLHKSFETTEALFTEVNNEARTNGFVTDEFLPKIMGREAMFPTGLQLEHRGVAIPHTDADTIKKEFVAVVVNDEPVKFHRMDDPDQTVNAKLVFVLGLNKPHAQLEMLQSLMAIIQDDALVEKLENVDSISEVHKLLSK